MIDLAQHVGAGNPERAHEVPHVEPVGAAGLRALLLRQPDFFFGDGGELVEPAELPGGMDRDRGSGDWGDRALADYLPSEQHVINRIITC